MNKLDGKLIVDRETLAAIITIVTSCNADYAALGNMRGMTYTMDAIQLMEEALAQDNTGWAAVPVVPTNDQLHEAFMNTDDLESREVARTCYTDMLNANPPLPGGGE